jgi:glutamate racemase
MSQAPFSTSAPIGVFDSGIGGLSVLQALVQQMPSEAFVYLADSGYAPYGERGDAYVLARSRACAQWLKAQGCQMIVVACNTATAAAIQTLRAEFPQLSWVGIEPALKPAVAATRSGHVAVLATRGTLESNKFAQLAAQQSASVKVTSLPCDGLADAIEQHNETAIATKIIAACAIFTRANGQFGTENAQKHPQKQPTAQAPDVAVLGCTHYPLVLPLWRAHLPQGVQIIDPAQAVARQAARLWGGPAQGAVAGNTPGQLHFATTGQLPSLQAAVNRYIGPQATTYTEAVQIPMPKASSPA